MNKKPFFFSVAQLLLTGSWAFSSGCASTVIKYEFPDGRVLSYCSNKDTAGSAVLQDGDKRIEIHVSGTASTVVEQQRLVAESIAAGVARGVVGAAAP